MTIADTTEFKQYEGGGVVRYTMTSDAITLLVEDGGDEAELRHGWAELAPPSLYKRVTMPDKWLWRGWTFGGIAMLAAPFILREHDPFRAYLVALAASLVIVAALTLTRHLRKPATCTEIPVSGTTLLVVGDEQHDGILQAIERHRRSFLLAHAPGMGATLREHLGYVELLRQHEIISAEEFAVRRNALLPGSVPEPAPETAPISFTQKSAGLRFDFAVEASRIVIRDSGLFRPDSIEAIPADRFLRGTQGRFKSSNESFAFALSCWLSAPFFAWALGAYWAYGPLMQGGQGWRNFVEFLLPPAVLTIVAFAAGRWLGQARVRVALPGITVLDNASAKPIIAAIERTRNSALHRLAVANPALTLAQQTAMLDELVSEGVIDRAERERRIGEAELVCTDPRLDQPIAPTA